MRNRAPFLAALIALGFLTGPAFAAPAMPLAEISSALSSNDGMAARRLADDALVQPDLDQADRARLLGERGLARNLAGDQDGALADLTQAVGTQGLTKDEQSRFYLERGLILDARNRLDDAAADYTAALRLEPSSAPALNNRANIFRRQNRFEQARFDYLASLAAGNPAPEYPYYGLGEIAESLGKPQEAIGFYVRAVTANPGFALAADRLAALGGAAPPEQAIILKPPKSVRAENTVPAVRRLRDKIPAVPARAVAVAASTAAIRPADYSDHETGIGETGPGLRMALDNSADNPRGQQVQLGAWRSEAEAAEAWNRAVKISGGALSGLAPRIVPADLPGKGRYYRLRVETADARALCTKLAAKALDCMPARE
jgi:tetratricopeptide (TPR) repeat protein